MPESDNFWAQRSGEAATAEAPVANTSADNFWAHKFDLSPEEDITRSHQAGLAAGRSPEEQSAYLRQKGYGAETVKKLGDQYKLDLATQNLGRFPGQKETILGSVGRQFVEHGIPFRSLFVNPEKDQAEAQKRFQEGKASEADIQTIARGQRRTEEEQGLQKSGVLGEVIGGLRAAPAVVGEYMVGNALASGLGVGQVARASLGGQLASHAARMAVITPVMPSMYMETARQKNLENGRPADSWEGLPAAGLAAYSKMLVLGGVFRGGASGGVAGAIKGGLTGATETAIADSATNFIDTFLPKAQKISTGYGTFEKLLTGDVSGAARKFAVDTLTFAAFNGMHLMADGLAPAEAARTAHDAAEVSVKDLVALKRKGYSEDVAFARVDAFNEQVKSRIKSDPDSAAKLVEYFKLRKDGVESDKAYEQAFKPSEPVPAQVTEAPKALEAAKPPQIAQAEPTSPTPTAPETPQIVQQRASQEPISGFQAPDVRPEGISESAKVTPEQAITPRTARDAWANADAADRANMPKAMKLQLFTAMKKAGYDPEKIKYVGESRVQQPDQTALPRELTDRIDASDLSDARKEGVKLIMSGGSTRAVMDTAGVSRTQVHTDTVKIFGKDYAKIVEEAGRVRLNERQQQQEQQQNAEARTVEGVSPLKPGQRRKAKSRPSDEAGEDRSFLKRFLEEEGGYLDLEAIKGSLFRAGEWLKWMAGKGKEGDPPGVKLDSKNIFPRVQNWGEYKRIVSEQQGAGRVPFLKWLFDPGRADTTPEGEVFVAHQAMKETGKDVAALWAIHEKQADKLFGTDKDGTYTRGDGTRGRIADDIEAEMKKSGQKFLSEEQQAWVKDVWTPALRDLQKMMREEGVSEWVDEDGNALSMNAKAYFPRQAVGKRDVDVTAGSGAGFEKSRSYDSEAEGADAGIIYDPSAKSRAAKFISQVYRTIADHRLATDTALKGETVDTRYQKLLAENETMLKSLDKDAREDLKAELKERAGHPVWGKERFVHSRPAFQGKIFPAEIAEKIEKMFKQDSADWIKNVERISAAAKSVALGGDMSFSFIQLLPTMMRHPVTWAKAMRESVLSIFDRQRMGKYLEMSENAQAARELTQLGSSVGRLHDFMAGLGQGEFATKIPVIGKAYEAAGRAFGTAMDVAKIELWKSYSKIAEPHELRAVAEMIDSMLLTGRMEGIGLSPQRRMAERLMMLAPSYYRGGMNLIATAFQRGTPGFLARQALGATMGGIMIASVGAMKAAGLSDNEVEERLNPARGKFLKIPVELGDGKKIEVGTSNILTSYVRLIGMGADHFSSDKPIDSGADGNPLLRWLRGKAAFAPRLSIDVWTGKDYFGKRQEPQEAVLRSFEPLLLQQILHGEGGVFEKGIGGTQEPSRANVADALVSAFGLSSYPGSKADEKYAVFNDEARKRFGADYDTLSFAKQAQVVKAAKNREDMPKPDPSSPQQMEQAFALQAERKTRITKSLSDDSQEKLSKLGKEVPGFIGTVSIGGEDVPIGRDRMKRYESLLTEEYDKTLGQWNVGRLKAMTPDAREKAMEHTLSGAKERAKNRLIHEHQ